jgi:hypothetical protein
LLVLYNKGLPGHSFVSRGTQRSELLDAFPLLVNAKIFRKCRRRQRHRAGPFQRIFAFVSVLTILSFGGFICSVDRNIMNRSSLWKGRARNKELMILEGKQVESHKKKQ